MWRKSITSPSCAWFIAAARSRSMTNRVCLWGHSFTMLTKLPIMDHLPTPGWHWWRNSFYVIRENLHTVAISSTTNLPRLVNIVKERPPVWSVICCYIRYIRTNGFKSLVGFDDKKHVCIYECYVYNSCKNTSRWLLQTNLSRSKSGVQLWALTRLASKKRNKKPKRMMRVLIR